MNKQFIKRLSKTTLPSALSTQSLVGRTLTESDIKGVIGGFQGSGEGTTSIVNGVSVDCKD